MAKRHPDYVVHAIIKHTEEKARVGAAWLNEDKSISVVLNPFTQLNASKNLLITLFPIDRENKEPF